MHSARSLREPLLVCAAARHWSPEPVTLPCPLGGSTSPAVALGYAASAVALLQRQSGARVPPRLGGGDRAEQKLEGKQLMMDEPKEPCKYPAAPAS